MRVTQNMMTRNYLRNLNTGITNLNKSQEKLTSGAKFTKTSENLSDAARSLKVRQTLYDNEKFLGTIRDAEDRLSSAESNLMSINDILVTAREKLILKSLNDPTGAQRDTMAKEIDNLKDQVVQFANAQFADKYLFSGTNNGAPPFTVDADGDVRYNDIKADTIFVKDGKHYYPKDDGTGTMVDTLVPENEAVYVDLGLGIVMTGEKTIDPRSAFKISFSGLDVLGCSESPTGESNNLFSLMKKAASALREEPFDRKVVEDVAERLKEQTEVMRLNVVDIGTRTDFLEKTTERLDNDNYNLVSLQQKLEVTDMATESINWKVFSAAWMATLQFGSKVLPVSLMDFIQ